MPESGRMGRNVDPVFAEVIDTLYGGALDAREAWDIVSKMSPDGADLHVPSGKLTERKRKTKLAETRTGQALNVVAAAGGGHAAYMTGRDIVREAKKPKVPLETGAKQLSFEGMPKAKLVPRIKTAVSEAAKSNRVLRPIAANPKRAALASLGAWGGLHTGELVGDAIAASALHRQAKELKKALDDVVVARREQRISTEQALTIAGDLIEKFSLVPGGGARKVIESQKTIANEVKAGPGSVRRAMRNGKRSLAVAGAAAAGAGGVAAYRHYKPKQTSASIADDAVAQADHIATGGMSREHRSTLLGKAADTVWTGEISKVDTEKRQVFGWCSLSQVDGQPVVDLQGDYVPLEEIEKAAYSYVLDSRKGGNMHERDGEAPKHVANLVESFVVTPEKLEQMGLAPDSLPHGWWVGFKVDDDETWEQVKSGERAGFSIHGKGKRIEKMLGAS